MTTPAPTTAETGVAAGRPQPQTTVESPGGPFIRHSQPGRRAMYVAQPGWGGLVAEPMVASPGYNSKYRLKITAGTGTGTSAAFGQDGMPNVVQLVSMKDAFGTPIIIAPGYEAFHLIPLYSGQFGVGETQDVGNLPSFVPGALTSGAGSFSTALPWEFSKAYGLISGANASLLPTLQMNINPASSVYTTVPSPAPPLNFTVDADYYWLPQGVSVEPPGIGTTAQWVLQPCTPLIASNGSMDVNLPRLGGYLTQLIFIIRDATNARVDGWPARPRFIVDGVPLLDSELTTMFDDMAIGDGVGSSVGGSVVGNAVPQGQAGTVINQRPVGTLTITRKTAMMQRHLGLLETGEVFLSTNPGTQVSLGGFPWGTVTNPPARLNALVGQIVPSGQLIQGLPEVAAGLTLESFERSIRPHASEM